MKKVSAVQFTKDKVIFLFEEGQSFQFCKDCNTGGKHFKTFMTHMASYIDLQYIGSELLIQFETRLYFYLMRGAGRRILRSQMLTFIDDLEANLGILESEKN